MKKYLPLICLLLAGCASTEGLPGHVPLLGHLMGFQNQFASVVIAMTLAIGLFGIVRNLPIVQEWVFPLLDDLRKGILDALNDHHPTDKKLKGHALIAAAIVTGISIYAFITLVSLLASW